jgi:putative membrane protein
VSGDGKEVFAAINATLNATSLVLLVLAYVMILRRNIRAHAYLMISALITSAVFLTTYVYSQFAFGERSSGLQSGPLKTFYIVLLASHVLLAIVMLPPILMTVWRAYTRQWVKHAKLARPTLWIWLYVSATGVIVYFMLYHLFPGLVRSGTVAQ